MISAVSNHGAAISAKRIINTAEMAKLGAITQFGPSPVPNVDANRSKSSAVKPVVPTTAWIPCMPSHGSVVRAAWATVKSTTTSQLSVGERVEVFVDGDAFDRFAGAARIDTGHENEFGVTGDRCTDGSTHPPGGSVDPDSHSFSLTDSLGQCVIRSTRFVRGLTPREPSGAVSQR